MRASTTNNVGGSAWQMASGFAQGSRWGLKGTEDPGGGYSALFQLENGFNVNNGTLAQGGRMFGRQAYVGGSARFGTLTLGRQYDAVVDYLAPTTANGSWGVPVLASARQRQHRQHVPREQHGEVCGPGFRRLFVRRYVQLQQRHGLREQPAVGVGAQYEQGGLLVGAAFLNADNPGATSGGAIAPGRSAPMRTLRRRGCGFSVRASTTRRARRSGSRTRTATSRGRPRTSATCSATKRSSR